MAHKSSFFAQRLTAGAALLLAASAAIANAQALPRLAGQIDSSAVVSLPNSVHPWARAEFDRGPVPGGNTGRLLLVLGRSDEQEQALKTLMAAQQDPTSPSYHKWLTPEEYGKRFGAADSDIQAIRGYLSSRGMNVGRVSSNRLSIEVTATADQIRSTFGTEIHAYAIQGKTFYANNASPRIPAALASVVRGFSSLNNFRAETAAPVRQGTLDRATHTVKPLYTTAGGTVFGVTPGDLANIYDVPSASTGVGAGGRNVTIGVVGDSDINVSYINNYRSVFGLSPAPITVVVDGNDPGITGDAYIAYKQLELLSAVAPNASLYYYTSATTDYDTGLNFALGRAVEDNQIQVLVVGYQACESTVGKQTGETLLINQIYEQAAAQGITVVAAAGNSGPAGCEVPGTAAKATTGFAVNQYASSPFVTAVGGTDFYYAVTPLTYWGAANSGTYTSALGYIPEQAWNDSTNQANPSVLLAGGGGVSTIGLDGTATPEPIPSYQSSNTKAAAISKTARILPDVAFFAGSGANDTLGYNSTAYLFCMQSTDCTGNTPQFTYSGGTEASAAVFAGAVALTVANKNAGTRYGLGNVNPALYSLLTGTNVLHHDITIGSTAVDCSGGNNCGKGAVMTGYTAGSGYDAATGLGSFDITSFVNNYAAPNTTPSNVTLTVLDPATNLAPVCKSVVNGVTQTISNCAPHSTSLEFIVKATSASGGNTVPTGEVAIFNTSPLASQQATESLTLSNGTATESSYNQLPGGTYKLYAHYAGDTVKGGTYAPSTSAPYQITIQPEPCFIQIYKNNIAGGGTIPYGSPVIITAEAYSTTNPNNVALDSGSLSVFDTYNGVRRQITAIPLNSQGAATFSSNLLSYGAHSIALAYNGDAGFGACQTAAYGVTVSKAATTTTINAAETDTGAGTASIGITAVVQSATLPSNATSPTGTVTFNTKTPKVVTLVPGFDPSGNAIATASTTVGQADVPTTGTINATYTPASTEVNYTASTSAAVPFSSTTATTTNSPTTTTFTITDSYGLSGSYPALDSLTLKLHVQASSPQSSFFIVYANGIQLTPPVSKFNGFSSGGLAIDKNGDATFVMPQLNGYLNLPSGQVQINVVYDGWASGDLSQESDPSSASQTITIMDDRTSADFSLQSDLTVNQQNPLIAPTTQAAFNLRLTSIYNFQSAYSTTPINLSCSVIGYTSPTGVHSTPSGLACGFNNALSTTTASVTFAASSATPGFITLPLYVGAASGYSVAANTPPALPGSPWWFATGGTTLACLFLLGLPGRRRNWQSMLGAVALMVVGIGMTGCGATTGSGKTYPFTTTNAGGTSGTGSNGTTGTAVPAGTYTVLVTASSTTNQALSHTLPVQVVVGAYN